MPLAHCQLCAAGGQRGVEVGGPNAECRCHLMCNKVPSPDTTTRSSGRESGKGPKHVARWTQVLGRQCAVDFSQRFRGLEQRAVSGRCAPEQGGVAAIDCVRKADWPGCQQSDDGVKLAARGGVVCWAAFTRATAELDGDIMLRGGPEGILSCRSAAKGTMQQCQGHAELLANTPSKPSVATSSNGET